MKKAKEYDWKDSNVELIGSNEDRAVKKEAAETEKAWNSAKACTEPALFIWRIEKFEVVEWPKNQYGEFYEGDSYIVLHVYLHEKKLMYDVHFWIGDYSTQDEYGTAAYKTVELDTLLDDKAIQHREVQHFESQMFRSYFKEIMYLKGGCDSGFRHIKTREYKPRLLQVKGDKRQVVITEVCATTKSLNSDDVFIYDTGTQLFQWIGKGANKDEKFKALQFTQQLNSDRNGKMKIEVLDEEDIRDDNEFNTILGNHTESFDSVYSIKAPLSKQEKKLFKISDETGSLKFEKISSGKINRCDINEEDVYIIDNGAVLYVYVGEHASVNEKKNALIYAHNYLKETEYPQAPITVMRRGIVGPNAEGFNEAFAA